jgi:hypothetical protein
MVKTGKSALRIGPAVRGEPGWRQPAPRLFRIARGFPQTPGTLPDRNLPPEEFQSKRMRFTDVRRCAVVADEGRVKRDSVSVWIREHMRCVRRTRSLFPVPCVGWWCPGKTSAQTGPLPSRQQGPRFFVDQGYLHYSELRITPIRVALKLYLGCLHLDALIILPSGYVK